MPLRGRSGEQPAPSLSEVNSNEHGHSCRFQSFREHKILNDGTSLRLWDWGNFANALERDAFMTSTSEQASLRCDGSRGNACAALRRKLMREETERLDCARKTQSP
jgi:hypothetical protein